MACQKPVYVRLWLEVGTWPYFFTQLLYLYMKNCNYTVRSEIIFSLLRRIANCVQRVNQRKHQFQKIHPMYFYSKKLRLRVPGLKVLSVRIFSLANWWDCTGKFFPNVWEICMILPRTHLLDAIFLTHRLSVESNSHFVSLRTLILSPESM